MAQLFDFTLSRETALCIKTNFQLIVFCTGICGAVFGAAYGALFDHAGGRGGNPIFFPHGHSWWNSAAMCAIAFGAYAYLICEALVKANGYRV